MYQLVLLQIPVTLAICMYTMNPPLYTNMATGGTSMSYFNYMYDRTKYCEKRTCENFFLRAYSYIFTDNSKS
jgi:hypothetical protein